MGDGGGGHLLVQMEWRPVGWSVCLLLLILLIFPCTIKSKSSLQAPIHPGGPGKRAVKRLLCGGGNFITHVWALMGSGTVLHFNDSFPGEPGWSAAFPQLLRSLGPSFLWSPYVIGQTIIFSSCGFFFFLLLLFPRLISTVGDWMSTILHTWCGPSVNLECRSEMCCTRLAENTGCKKVAKNRHLGTIAQLCRAISWQLRHVSTIGKKLKQQYVLQMSPQYGELRPTSGWDSFVSLGHPTKFQLV